MNRTTEETQPHYTDARVPCTLYVSGDGKSALHTPVHPVRRPHRVKRVAYHYSHTDTVMNRDHYVTR